MLAARRSLARGVAAASAGLARRVPRAACLSTSRPAADAETEKLDRVRDQLHQSLQARDKELAAEFGAEAPHEAWAMRLFEHQRTELLVPALHRWFEGDAAFEMDASTQAYLVGLTSHVLRRLSPEEAGDTAFRLMFYGVAPKEFVLGALRMGGPFVGKEIFGRFADSLTKATAMAVESGQAPPAAAEHISNTMTRLEAVDVSLDLLDQPLPHMERHWAAEGFEGKAVGGATGAGAKAHALECVPYIREIVTAQPDPDQEGASSSDRARVFWTACSLAHTQLLLGAFHATGDAAIITRICDGVVPWASALRDGDSSAGVSPSEPVESENSAKAMSVGVAGMCAQELIKQSRTHPVVFRAVAEAVSDLAEAVPAGAVRSRAAKDRLEALPHLLFQMASAAVQDERS
ncbi:hypothetical protein FNF27_01052 [Cafeteria roenbergensis]|nr:hypothetical protein FNF27_01052 [Cafeteria roenbergensis]